MAAVKGYIEKIKYRNEDNGYTVLSISGLDDGEEYVLVGTFSYIAEGEMIEASGRHNFAETSSPGAYRAFPRPVHRWTSPFFH